MNQTTFLNQYCALLKCVNAVPAFQYKKTSPKKANVDTELLLTIFENLITTTQKISLSYLNNSTKNTTIYSQSCLFHYSLRHLHIECCLYTHKK